MKNLLVRSLTGIVFVGLILGALLWGEFSFAILFLLILLGAMYEFFSISESAGFKPLRFLNYLSGAALFAVSFLVSSDRIDPKWFFLVFVLLLGNFIYELFANKKTPIQNVALGHAAFIYAALPISLANFLVFPKVESDYSPKLFLALLILIWVYDSFAYLFGVSMGKHRLYERISPKKSWEGAIGGTLAALGVSFAIGHFIPQIAWFHWLAIAFLVVVFSTLGDLTESMLKRQFGVKDSGTIFPGHGGILDRFDSLLFAIPVMVAYLELFI